MSNIKKLQHEFARLPKAVAAFAVFVMCPCGANALMAGQALSTDANCPHCGRAYELAVISRLRQAADMNKANLH